jgi:hypothetical protein
MGPIKLSSESVERDEWAASFESSVGGIKHGKPPSNHALLGANRLACKDCLGIIQQRELGNGL